MHPFPACLHISLLFLFDIYLFHITHGTHVRLLGSPSRCTTMPSFIQMHIEGNPTKIDDVYLLYIPYVLLILFHFIFPNFSLDVTCLPRTLPFLLQPFHYFYIINYFFVVSKSNLIGLLKHTSLFLLLTHPVLDSRPLLHNTTNKFLDHENA